MPARPLRLRPFRAFHSSAAAILFGFSSIVVAAAQTPNIKTAVLSTSDTTVTVEAGDQAPRLIALSLHGGWALQGRVAERLPDHVEMHGLARPLKWRLDPAASHEDSSEIALVYLSDSPALRLVWRWRARAASGPIEHTIEIENLGNEMLWLPLQPSLTFDWAVDPRVRLERLWVEKGADAPSAAGTHLDPLRDGDRWQGTSSTYARPVAGELREMFPWVLVEEPDGRQRGWYLGIEFSGRTRIALERENAEVRGDAGLNPSPGPYRTRLPAGGRFATPEVFIGAFDNGFDNAGNILRHWIREVLAHAPTLHDPSYPLLTSNSWGSGMAVNEPLARHMIEDAASLGLEMFHLDAGWFRSVGDWRADPAKFPGGIAAVADVAHAHGLRFGLWVSWAQAGMSRKPRRAHDPQPGDARLADRRPSVRLDGTRAVQGHHHRPGRAGCGGLGRA